MTKILSILMMLCCVCLCVAYTPMQTSDAGKEFIKSYEKCVLERYWDNGAYSIGYGHRMTGNMKAYKKIDMQTANRLFDEDIALTEKYANTILKKIKWQPSQSFFDGLVSVIYNAGIGGVQKTEFYRRLLRCRVKDGKVNSNDLSFTVAAIKTARIPDSRYADGVKKRRHAEHLMMLK